MLYWFVKKIEIRISSSCSKTWEQNKNMRYIFKAGSIPSLFAMTNSSFIQSVVKNHKILRRLRMTQKL
jgi:hypothetical protein